MAKVKVIPNASVKCKYGSWLEHYEKHSSYGTPKYCVVGHPDCLRRSAIGAVVVNTNGTDKTEYVAPLCHHHSQTGQTIEISDLYELVPVRPGFWSWE